MMNEYTNTSNRENTYIFAPIANELFQRVLQLVQVKVGGFVLRLALFPGIRQFGFAEMIERVDMRAGCIVT